MMGDVAAMMGLQRDGGWDARRGGDATKKQIKRFPSYNLMMMYAPTTIDTLYNW